MRIWLLLPLTCLMVFLAVQIFLPSSPTAQGFGEARVGGAFRLTNTHGKTVSDSDFRGRLMLVYMGYSHCPDICPLTLSVMSDALKNLGENAEKVAVLFITLDPERDTPQALGDFLKNFDPRILGLTGSRAEIDKVAKEYLVFSQKNVTPNTGSYLVDHSGLLYLMDTRGKYLAHFGPDVKPEDIVKAVRASL